MDVEKPPPLSSTVGIPPGIPKPDTSMFDALTGVRAMAAYMVFFVHCNGYNMLFGKQGSGSFIHNFISEFYTGVTVFFVLSGFLICYRYYDNINLPGKAWIAKYIQNRIARLYPVYFAATTLTFAMIILKSSHVNTFGVGARIVPWGGQGLSLVHDIKLYLLNITFLRGLFSHFYFTGVGQGWTLTVEGCFYLSAPLIFYLSKKIKISAQCIAIFFAGVIGMAIFSNIDWYGFLGNIKFMLFYTFFGRCFEFFVGIKLALMVKNKQYGSNFKYRTTLGMAWITACLIIMTIARGRQIASGIEYLQYVPGLPYAEIAVNNFVLPIGIAIFFLGLITEKTYLSKMLGSSLFVLLGKSSYSFYLIHVAVINILFNGFSRNTFVIFVIANALAILVFKTIEQPSNKYLKRLNMFPAPGSSRKPKITFESNRAF
jgi:peptidoglycan/LPS O-acetylase OafA/YrhL